MFIKKAKCQQLRHWPDEKLAGTYSTTGQVKYLNELFNRYAPRLFRICNTYFKDSEKSRDMVMVIFAKVHSELPTANFRSFDSWIFFLARNMCISHIRKEERQNRRHHSYLALFHKEEPQVENEALSKMDHYEKRYTTRQLKKALNSLPVRQRRCIELFFFEKKSYREIAEETGFAVNTVKSCLQNGKRRLKGMLSPGA